MYASKKFATLPKKLVSTTDGTAIDKEGNFILSCPNFATDDLSGCVLKITPDGSISKWFDVPINPDTGIARNMGITFDSEWNLYICDNQGWSGKKDLVDQGRLLKLKVEDDGTISSYTVMAKHMHHPNGVAIRDNQIFVTQSEQVDQPGKFFKSALYVFDPKDHDIDITNTDSDENIFSTFITKNPEVLYGLDGVSVNSKNELFVGNYGDAEIEKIQFNSDGSYAGYEVFAHDRTQLESTDGIQFDEYDNMYVADFDKNSIARVTPDGKVERIASNDDNDGLNGEVNQPGEVRPWRGKLMISNFNLVTGPTKVNTGHSEPQTIAYLDLK